MCIQGSFSSLKLFLISRFISALPFIFNSQRTISPIYWTEFYFNVYKLWKAWISLTIVHIVSVFTINVIRHFKTILQAILKCRVKNMSNLTFLTRGKSVICSNRDENRCNSVKIIYAQTDLDHLTSLPCVV